MKRTFVVGDVHGNLSRLEALLEKANVTSDDEVVQLGDLGDFRRETQSNDAAAYRFAALNKIIVLWGNHDRAAVDQWQHSFRGFYPPPKRMLNLIARVKPRFAYEAHGFLLTHAGLHPSVTPAGPKRMIDLVAHLNSYFPAPLWDAISHARGGFSEAGGILWRDDCEELWDGVPQIYGHSRGDIRRYGKSWCVDVASKENDCLAGIWLPEEKVVAIGPDADIFETQGRF